MNQHQIDNHIINGPLLRESSRGLWNEMSYLVHGLASECMGENVFIYKLIRKEEGLSVQKILGWVNKKAVSFSEEPVESASVVKTTEGKSYFCVGERLLTRVVR